MKKFKFGSLAGLLVLLSVSAFAEGRLPVNIQTAFKSSILKQRMWNGSKWPVATWQNLLQIVRKLMSGSINKRSGS